jgi:hypothetical protein
MRKQFHQFFRPRDPDLEALWVDGLFSFDASVLLNVYGYSNETSQELVALLEAIAARTRLPHQFGLEYSRNRSIVILRQVSNYRKVIDRLAEIKRVDLDPKRDHPFLSQQSAKAFEKIQKELENERRRMEKLIGNDPLAERILSVFDGRVGPEPSEQELVDLHKDAQDRYGKLIPPGYADLKEKGVPDAYGDYIGWRQLMAIAAEQQKGIILVTDDAKDDWWRIEKERTIGPRPEILAEFARIAQQPFYMYTSENFLRAAKTYLSADIGDKAIEEVSQRLASQKLSQRPSEYKNAAEKAGSPIPAAGHGDSSIKTSLGLKDVVEGIGERAPQKDAPDTNGKAEASHGS